MLNYISSNSVSYKYSFCLQILKCQNFYFKQFSLAKVQFSSIWSIDRTLWWQWMGTPHIPQNFSITGAWPSNCLVSYPGHLLERGLTLLQKSSQYILQPQLTGQNLFVLNLHYSSSGTYSGFFLFLMTYQLSWVIQCQSYPCRTVVIIIIMLCH